MDYKPHNVSQVIEQFFIVRGPKDSWVRLADVDKEGQVKHVDLCVDQSRAKNFAELRGAQKVANFLGGEILIRTIVSIKTVTVAPQQD